MNYGASIFYQGEPGCFSEAAILSHWPQTRAVPMSSFEDVVEALTARPESMGLLPIENAYRGPVYDVLDLLTNGVAALGIRAEVVQPVRLSLLARPGTTLEDITVVRSHPQALMQSRGYWGRRGWRAEPTLDTAGSARELAESEAPGGVAAIASPLAGNLYGLNILADNIHDHKDNRTRFWLLSQDPVSGHPSPLGVYKTSIIFDVPNVPGSLVTVLEHFSRHGLNMNKVESRPRPGVPFAFRFWVDITGDSQRVVKAVADAGSDTEWLRVLGECYPVLDQ